MLRRRSAHAVDLRCRPATESFACSPQWRALALRVLPGLLLHVPIASAAQVSDTGRVTLTIGRPVTTYVPGASPAASGSTYIPSGVIARGGVFLADPYAGVLLSFPLSLRVSAPQAKQRRTHTATVDTSRAQWTPARTGSQRPWWIGSCAGADTLYVWSRDQRVVRIWRGASPTQEGRPLPGSVAALACSGDGRFVLMSQPRPVARALPPEQSAWRRALAKVTGARVQPVEVVSVQVHDVIRGHTTLIGELELGDVRPGGWIPQVAAGAGVLAVGRVGRAELEIYTESGHLRHRLAVPAHRKSMTDRYWAAAVEALAAMFHTPEQRARARAMLARTARPSRLPPYRTVHVSRTGDVWVVLSPIGEPETRALVFVGARGAPIEVVIPASIRVLDIDSTYLLGVSTASDTTSVIQLYALPPRLARAAAGQRRASIRGRRSPLRLNGRDDRRSGSA